jgi:hypothetical protein
MLPFILFSTLLSPILTESEKQQWFCNSSDAIISYSYCGKWPGNKELRRQLFREKVSTEPEAGGLAGTLLQQ